MAYEWTQTFETHFAIRLATAAWYLTHLPVSFGLQQFHIKNCE